jgi:hypothetical protein
VDAQQRRSREDPPESLADDGLQRPGAQRTDVQAVDGRFWKR